MRRQVCTRLSPCAALARLVLGGCLGAALGGCLQPGRPTGMVGVDAGAPLGAQDNVLARRLPEVQLGPSEPARGAPTESETDTGGVPRLNPVPSQTPLPESARGNPADVPQAQGIELDVTAPERRPAGTQVTYRITVRNVSSEPIDAIEIRCRFEKPLEFDGSEQREVVQMIDSLPSGESKELALSLSCALVGRYCCRFSASPAGTGDQGAAASKSVCVQFVTRQLSIEMLGPRQRIEGSRAEFNITLTNQSVRTLSGVKAVLSYDQALTPREASAGAERAAGMLTWDLGTLQPMEIVQVQVDFECRTLARRACVALEVRTSELAPERDEACVEVLPLTGTLDLQVTDRDDPLEVGRRGVYEITVRNVGLQPARKVVVEAVVPESLKVVSTTARNSDGDLKIGSRAEGEKLIFDAIEELAANEPLTLLVEVEALAAGAVEFQASVSTALSQAKVTVLEPTSIAEP